MNSFAVTNVWNLRRQSPWTKDLASYKRDAVIWIYHAGDSDGIDQTKIFVSIPTNCRECLTFFAPIRARKCFWAMTVRPATHEMKDKGAIHSLQQVKLNWEPHLEDISFFFFFLFLSFFLKKYELSFCIISQQSLGEGSKSGSGALNWVKRDFHFNSNLSPEVQQLPRTSCGMVTGCCLQAAAAGVSEIRAQGASCRDVFKQHCLHFLQYLSSNFSPWMPRLSCWGRCLSLQSTKVSSKRGLHPSHLYGPHVAY